MFKMMAEIKIEFFKTNLTNHLFLFLLAVVWYVNKHFPGLWLSCHKYTYVYVYQQL